MYFGRVVSMGVQNLRKLYLTIFVIFFRLGAGQWPSHINADAHKGVVGIASTEAILVVCMIFWLRGWTGHGLALNSWQLWGLVLLPFLLNHYFLVAKGYGVSFEREFDFLKQREKSLLYSEALGILVATAAIAYFTILANRRLLGIE